MAFAVGLEAKPWPSTELVTIYFPPSTKGPGVLTLALPNHPLGQQSLDLHFGLPTKLQKSRQEKSPSAFGSPIHRANDSSSEPRVGAMTLSLHLLFLRLLGSQQ